MWSLLLAGGPHWLVALPYLPSFGPNQWGPIWGISSCEATRSLESQWSPFSRKRFTLHVYMMNRSGPAGYGVIPYHQEKKDPIRGWLQ